jgi:hypothetical protein
MKLTMHNVDSRAHRDSEHARRGVRAFGRAPLEKPLMTAVGVLAIVFRQGPPL